MEANSARWHRVTPSTFPWEDEAIEFLRARIADADPNHAWSNFEFISGGVISEVDVFLLTRKGAFLIEIKSTPGRLVGDQQRWTFHRPDGGRTTMENPLLGANRKAKRIKSLLEHKWRAVAGPNAGPHPPFIEPVVFLSDPHLKVELTADARVHVFGRDGSEVTDPQVRGGRALEGIVAGVNQIGGAEANNSRFRQLNTPVTEAATAALKQIGIKESNHTRRIGSWLLRLDTVTERPGIQDFVAEHQQSPGVQRRVRIYSKQPQMSDEQATSLQRAATREFQAADRLSHPHVVRAIDQIDTELGTAVVFDHEPTADRLDHWLAAHEDLDLDDRLGVLRQLAETLQAVHRRRVTHRSLSPGSVLVRPGRTGEPAWVVLVTDFSLAGKDHHGSSTSTTATRGTRGFGLVTAAPGDVALLADESALLFCAPELATDDDPDGVALDVFAFGAIAFQVLSGKAPGDSPEAVRAALRAGQGLQLAAADPGTAEALHELVLEATRPMVSERLSSFDEALAWLDLAEEQLTAPSTITADPVAEPLDVDPLDAKVGDVLGDGSVVKRKLGSGSTARALLVDRGADTNPREVVYKVSLGGEADARLRAEAEVLHELRHPAVVELYETVELAGRPVLVEAQAGRQSLADELRRNGTPGIEFLERWGSDLLEAVRYLERLGRIHRDIKPDNLGVTEIGANKEQHLVLFDFSLAAARPTDLRAGTPPYLEPFLAERPSKQWDLAAERYAVAMTLYEMATGEAPRWGDGRSDPSFTTDEVALDIVLFDPAARDPLEAFFRKALRRDPGERFGNAEEMLRAWQRVFEGLDRRETGPVGQQPAPMLSDTGSVTLPDVLSLGDPILSLGASAKVVSALDRLEVATVAQLAGLAPADVTRARRISPRVRRRIQEIRAAVRARFAEELAASTAVTTPAVSTVPTEDQVAELADLELDRLVPLLLPPPGRKKSSSLDAVRMLLGLDPVPGAEDSDWAPQTAVADALGITRGRVGQIGPAARKQWAEAEALQLVRDQVVALVDANAGVVGVRELLPLLVDLRGSAMAPADAEISARAVLRAAIEAEELGQDRAGTTASRLLLRRRGARVIVALDGDVADGPDGRRTLDGSALTAYAAALGDRADELVGLVNDVIPQDRAVAQLRRVEAPVVVSDGRLLRLAAACSQNVAVSSALELYPTDLDPLRAVRLARQSLASAEQLTPDEVRSRVQARFPATSLPGRPELDRLLADADVAVRWSDSGGHFIRGETRVGDLSTMTAVVSRRPTAAVAPVRSDVRQPTEVDPAVAEARDIDGRLHRSLEHGGFLALRVPTSQRRAAQAGLAHLTGAPWNLVTVDLERWFLAELRGAAEVRGASWSTVVNADAVAPGSMDHSNLRQLTKEAAAGVEARVLAAGSRVLAWNPGVLAAYDELGVIDRLRTQAGTARSPLRLLWLVVLGSTADALPTVDGQAVPVLGPSEWLDLREPWLRNLHGQQRPTGTTSPKDTL